MNEIEKLFKKVNNAAFHKFEDQNFKKISTVHDWRNYVPDEILKHWHELTEKERKLIFIVCEKMADEEDWD